MAQARKSKTIPEPAYEKPSMHYLFPTILLHQHWDWTPKGRPIAEFNEELTLALYKQRANDPAGINRSNMAGCYHGPDGLLQHLGDPLGAELAEMFRQLFHELATQHMGKRDAHRGWKLAAWSMMMKQGGYSTPHCHPNCHFSGVYYVDAGTNEKQEGKTVEGSFEAVDTRNVNTKIPGSVLQPAFRLTPRTGDLVVFPSWLPHFVHPVFGENERISIACNATLAKYDPPTEEKK